MLSRILLGAAGGLLLAVTTPALALVLTPTSYDMNNGHGQASGGSFNYWDLS